MSEYIPKIPVEDLVHITFMDPDPDNRDREGREMKRDLMTALKNGNINKQKYNIIFHSTSGVLKIYSTIWMVGEKYIGVKGNIVIPIYSILDVKL
jgi:hypothetical protein